MRSSKGWRPSTNAGRPLPRGPRPSRRRVRSSTRGPRPDPRKKPLQSTGRTHQSPNPTGIFPFFTLPAEIRSEIYDHALVTPLLGIKVRLPASEGQGPNHQVQEVLKLLKTLWTVSRSMYSETLLHFLEHNHFHWHGNLTTTAWDSFQLKALGYVRTLSISISDYQICWMKQSKLRNLLKYMGNCSKLTDEQSTWKLRSLELIVRNDYYDVDRDDQVWFHWKTVKDSQSAVPASAGRLPHIQGLQRLAIIAPWDVEQDWKDKFVEEAGQDCVVDFGRNYDRAVPKPRVGPWEKR